MIRSIIKNQECFSIVQGLPEPGQDHNLVWLEVHTPTVEEGTILQQRFGIETAKKNSNVVEDGQFLYMRSRLLALDDNGAPHFGGVTFALGEQLVAIICDDANFQSFDIALQRLRRKPANGQSPKAIMRSLLQIANDRADELVDQIAEELEKRAEDISEISDGYNANGMELGVPDLIETMRALNAKEELIALCIETQLSLARTVRYLSSEIDSTNEADLQGLVNELAFDVAGVKEHAYFEHQKVQYLQKSVTNILNIKQNQIVKVFTIITAVFLPPTLVGTFYGMNFAVMPELSWEHGFVYSMGLTLSAAVLPLIYIKRKGWLR
ncbi:CorA family divalent cation transporter [Pseudomonas sp. SWRI154]|uniref:CorA family divalent cation transporter n=1 Tax=Pseudomonas sp. SWRI154 TaxID=2745501 RepID=UPI0016491AF0|nr:CorA family divalent cation transporter [Pseudomonas sp. SWRI154]MBC3364400.1 magnesium transporter CorA [Pseudomonas sp. SWRI154]